MPTEVRGNVARNSTCSGTLNFDSRDAHQADGYGGPGGRASFDGWTTSVAQRVGVPLRAGGGLTLTPWAGLAYARQATGGFTLEDPGLGEQRYSGVEVGEAPSS